MSLLSAPGIDGCRRRCQLTRGRGGPGLVPKASGASGTMHGAIGPEESPDVPRAVGRGGLRALSFGFGCGEVRGVVATPGIWRCVGGSEGVRGDGGGRGRPPGDSGAYLGGRRAPDIKEERAATADGAGGGGGKARPVAARGQRDRPGYGRRQRPCRPSEGPVRAVSTAGRGGRE